MVATENAIKLRQAERHAILATWVLFLATTGSSLLLRAQTEQPDSGASLTIDREAPAWSTRGWINAESLDIKQFRGKVVLLRFLNDETTGGPTLNDVYRTYRVQGLAVVGMFAPSPMPSDIPQEHVRDFARAKGFEFPIGVDSRWETMNRYWLDRADAEQGAATFLIDRKGIVRYIQHDGQYEKNSANRTLRREYEKLQKAIETILKSDDAKAGGGK